jgi:hypothetical protein
MRQGAAVVAVCAQLVSQIIYCFLTPTRIDSFKNTQIWQMQLGWHTETTSGKEIIWNFQIEPFL